VLLDLGFARPIGSEPTEELGAAGSLAYLAPERARGQPGGPESDVFALGVVLYELATGVHPFSVATKRDFA
jgi:serine/threonine-protein kinase